MAETTKKWYVIRAISGKEKKVKEITFFEIEDKFFEKRILNSGKKNSLKINQVKSPMFLMERQ